MPKGKSRIRIPCKECIVYAICKNKENVVCKPLHKFLQLYAREETWLEFSSLFSISTKPTYIYRDNKRDTETFICFLAFSEKNASSFLAILSDHPTDGMSTVYSEVRTGTQNLIWSWFQESGTNPFN